MEQVRRRFPHTLELRFDTSALALPRRRYAEQLAVRDEVEVCCGFLAHVRGGQGASAAERALLAEAVEAVRVGRATEEDEGQLALDLRGAGAA
jgi:exonuclease SbcD